MKNPHMTNTLQKLAFILGSVDLSSTNFFQSKSVLSKA